MDGDGARHGIADALDRGRVGVVDDAEGLLPVPVRCCVVCSSQLSLPLSDCVPVVVVAVVFQLYLEGGRHGDKGVDRGRVVIVDVDKGL